MMTELHFFGCRFSPNCKLIIVSLLQ